MSMQAASGEQKTNRCRQASAVEVDRLELVRSHPNDDGGLVVIEAPAGFGKTVLATQYAATFAHQLWVTEIDTGALDAAIDRVPADGAGWCVVIDDAERFDSANVDALDALVALVSAAGDRGAAVVVAGRRVPDVVWAAAAVQVDTDDLMLTSEQIEQHVPSSPSPTRRSSVAGMLTDVTRGWVMALARPLERLRDATAEIGDFGDDDRPVNKAIADIMRHSTAQAHLLEPLLQQLSPDDIAFVRTLALLDRFDAEIISLLQAPVGFVERASAAGLLTTRDGLSLPEVFRSILSEVPTPPADIDCRAVADYLVERGEIARAIEVCMAVGDHEQATETIAGLEHRHGFLVDVDEFNRSITLLPDAAARRPRVFLVQCWVNIIALRLADAMRALGRAHDTVVKLDPERTTHVHAEVLAELAFYAAIERDREATDRYLADLASFNLEGSNSETEARMLEARSGLAVLTLTTESFDAANRDLSAATAIWRRHGDSARLVSALMRLAVNVLEPMGRYRQSMNMLDEALEQRSLAAFDRARIEMFRSRMLPLLGRNDDAIAACAEADRLAAQLDVPWIMGMTAWAQMRAAAYAEDEEAMLASFATAESRLGELLNHQTGAIFRCEAADAFARFGRLEEAEDLLAAGRTIADGEPFAVLAAIAVQARAGDASTALDLIDAASPELGMVWLAHALAAHALQRLGRTEEAVDRLARSSAELDRLGQHDVLDTTERRLVQGLAAAGRAASQRAASPSTASRPTTTAPPPIEDSGLPTYVRVFGGFAIEQDGVPLPQLPRGRPTELVKFLVVNEGRVVIDQAIEALWPGCDLPTGRQRMRNVLRRCRTSLGPIIDRDGDCLTFSPNVTSDYGEALTLVDDACVHDPDSLEAADAAVAAMSERLLPDDRYDDWAEFARADFEERRDRVRDHQRRLAVQHGVSRPG